MAWCPALTQHRSCLAAGATTGVVAGLGIAYARGVFDNEGGVPPADVLRFIGTVLVGLGIGELGYRLTPAPTAAEPASDRAP